MNEEALSWGISPVFSFEIFLVNLGSWWCISGVLKRGLSIHFIPNFSMVY
jgi:hypothetical protein